MNEFLVKPNIIKENYSTFKDLGPVYFPLKANNSECILNILKANFDKVDKFAISSKNQLYILDFLNIDPLQISLINPFFTLDELEDFYSFGIRDFVFDNINTFKAFKEKHSDITSSVRLSISEIFDVDFGFVGASLNNAKKMIKLGCSLSIYCQASVRNGDFLTKVFNTVKELKPNVLRLSGITPKHISQIKVFADKTNIKIITEPGQHLLINSIDYKCDIFDIKTINNTNYIILNTSIFSGLLDTYLYNKQFDFYIEDMLLLNSKKENAKKYVICGCSSDSKDILGTWYLTDDEFNLLLKTNCVTIKDTGSYFEVFNIKYGKKIDYKYTVLEDLSEDS